MQPLEINPKFSAKASVIWLHGLGADANDFVDIVPHLGLSEKLAVRFIFPNAPFRPVTLAQGLTMRAWFDIPALRAADFDSDKKAIYASQKTIEELIERETARGIPSEKIVLAGFSQGGTMALQCGLRYTKPLAGILVLSSVLVLADKLKDEKNPINQNVPILMLHGDKDNVVPLIWAQASYQKLRDLHYPICFQTYPMQHTVCDEEITKIGQWLGEVLG